MASFDGPIPHALLLGAPGRYPFNGHLRLRVERGAARLSIAGSVASGFEPPVAWGVAGRLRSLLGAIEGRGRFGLLRDAWERLSGMDPDALGPSGGEDLALLLVAEDDEGLCLAGTGLSALYALEGDTAEELLPRTHPMLQLVGVPPSLPGVFTPHRPPSAVIAAARSGAVEPGRSSFWWRDCGLRSKAVE